MVIDGSSSANILSLLLDMMEVPRIHVPEKFLGITLPWGKGISIPFPGGESSTAPCRMQCLFQRCAALVGTILRGLGCYFYKTN